MPEADRHASEAKDWISEFQAADTKEERLGALQFAKAEIENAKREVSAE